MQSFTRLKYAVMAQLVHMTVTMNAMQAQLKTLVSTQKNQTGPKQVLMLDLREQFRSQEQNLLSKESITSRGSLLQKSMGGSERDVNDG